MENYRILFMAHQSRGERCKYMEILSKHYDFTERTCDVCVEFDVDSPVTLSIRVNNVIDDRASMIVDFECGSMEQRKCSLYAEDKRSGVLFDGFFDTRQEDEGSTMTPNLLFLDALDNLKKNLGSSDGHDELVQKLEHNRL
ncbi:16.2 kDa PutA/Proline dehydrogenase [Spodoptera frugiperda ascovirus 1a]|uniref:16.2 kDa PutA/Proline dehydrogenase n=1 Tax=Spodoptera frugiperda ascovirus 1a TaxID=113370 RepID=Q0E4Z4_SFAVA|nr:16.2 kDa PutA/Proline dehydrogenase [Spodoptera frugiperda ascovirus 1a]CAL44707.1 16.2 kDa PutA/Proline dehydrogenase [Spodoptera frugiperda ascovirus 1a]